MTLSVVIPTLNEASELPETLKRTHTVPEVYEIIVVDAGSTDDTRAVAREHNCTVLESKPSRGTQLRLGAQRASGDVVLFLHADTWLPENTGTVIAETLARPLVVAGGFYKRFRDGGALPGSRLRCWLLWALANRLFGDQAFFVKREVLEQCGGVPAVPLMEEFELCKRLAPHGRLALASATVLTSARKFRKHGILRTHWLMTRCITRYCLGTSPQRLAEIYHGKNTDVQNIQDEKLIS